MTAYLLTWNPRRFPWRPAHIERMVAQSAEGMRVVFPWSSGRSLKAKKGDRVFLTRLGRTPRGIFASGYLARDAYFNAKDDEYGNEVKVSWDVVLDPRDDDNLFNPLASREPAFAEQAWTPQMSGTQVRPEAAAALESRWREHCEKRRGHPELVSYPFQVREHLQLQIPLPWNLTLAEAKRLGAFIHQIATSKRRPLARGPRLGLGPSTDLPQGPRVSFPKGVVVRRPIRGGATTGKAVGSGAGYVNLAMQLGGPKATRVVLPAGLLMISKNPGVQNGLLAQEVKIRVPANANAQWLLAMYCANRGRRSADEQTKFELGPVTDDPGLQELCALLEGKTIREDQTALVQKAVWEITDGGGLSTESRAAIGGMKR